jgi:uncharacterized membrane protein
MSINGYDVSENWLNILVLVHVLSAIIGIGPVFFGHVLLRKGQTLNQLKSSLALSKLLEMFPKILGSLAVVTGILLAWLGDYGFKALWIYGGIVLYVIIQVVVIGFMVPASKKLNDLAKSSSDPAEQPFSGEIAAGVAKVDRLTWIASSLGVLLFLFMFFKPTL